MQCESKIDAGNEESNVAFSVDKNHSSFFSSHLSNEDKNSCINVNQNTIKIFACQPYIRIRSIKLKIVDSISILYRIYSEDSIYIFKGQILDTSKTFSDYKINDKSKIVIISSYMTKSNPILIEKWKKITSDQELFEEIIGNSINIRKCCKREMARIKDVSFYKFEIHGKKYVKLIKTHRMKEGEMHIEHHDHTKLKVDYASSNAPSNKPLPILW